MDKVRGAIRAKSVPERLQEARAELLGFVAATQTLCQHVGALLHPADAEAEADESSRAIGGGGGGGARFLAANSSAPF